MPSLFVILHNNMLEKLWGKDYGPKNPIERTLRARLPKGIKLSDEVLQWLFYNTENLPIDPDKFNFHVENLEEGGSARVYLLNSQTEVPSLALKVYKSDESRASTPLELATVLKRERKEIANLYSSIPDLIPNGNYIVAEDPFKKGRAAAMLIEPFVNGEFFDLFLPPSSPEQISALAKKDPEFKNQLVKFIKITIAMSETESKIVDIHAPKNLIVTERDDGSIRLVFLDPHGYIKTRGDWREKGVTMRLDFLKKVLSLIEN